MSKFLDEVRDLSTTAQSQKRRMAEIQNRESMTQLSRSSETTAQRVLHQTYPRAYYAVVEAAARGEQTHAAYVMYHSSQEFSEPHELEARLLAEKFEAQGFSTEVVRDKIEPSPGQSYFKEPTYHLYVRITW